MPIFKDVKEFNVKSRWQGANDGRMNGTENTHLMCVQDI
jgi:hypothetical protein